MDHDQELYLELFGSIRIYKNGRVERLVGTDAVPAGVDPATGVVSKDVIISRDTGVSARLFLPDLSGLKRGQKLPVLVYYHGGGFCVHSPFSSAWTSYLKSIVSQARVVAVSVDYRLAPEHPLPAAYHDSFAAIQWVSSHANGGGEEPWLRNHGDFDRVFLAGDTAGGAIAHYVAMQVGLQNASIAGARIGGMALIHPHFCDEEPFKDEAFGAQAKALWATVCPGTTGFDDPLINPLAPAAPSLTALACDRVLVELAEKDWLSEQGRRYYGGLKASGWPGEAELHLTDGQPNGFHRQDPTSAKAKALMQRLAAFLNDPPYDVFT